MGIINYRIMWALYKSGGHYIEFCGHYIELCGHYIKSGGHYIEFCGHYIKFCIFLSVGE